MNPEKLIVHAYDPPCHYRLPAQWPSTCRVQAGSQPSCSSLGKTWCSALPSASPILGHSCCYQGTHVSTWVTGVVVIPEESENSQAYFSYLLELLIVCYCLGCQRQEEKEETIAEKHLETTAGQR